VTLPAWLRAELDTVGEIEAFAGVDALVA